MSPKERPDSGAVPGHALVSGVKVVVPLKELIDVEASWAMRTSFAMPRLMWWPREQAKLKARLAKNEESRADVGAALGKVRRGQPA